MLVSMTLGIWYRDSAQEQARGIVSLEGSSQYGDAWRASSLQLEGPPCAVKVTRSLDGWSSKMWWPAPPNSPRPAPPSAVDYTLLLHLCLFQNWHRPGCCHYNPTTGRPPLCRLNLQMIFKRKKVVEPFSGALGPWIIL